MEATTATMAPVDAAPQPPRADDVERHEKSDAKTVVDETVAFLQNEVCAQESNSADGEVDNEADESVEETVTGGVGNGKTGVAVNGDGETSENKHEQIESQNCVSDVVEGEDDNDDLAPMRYNEDEEVWVKMEENSEENAKVLEEKVQQKVENDKTEGVGDVAEKLENLVIVEEKVQRKLESDKHEPVSDVAGKLENVLIIEEKVQEILESDQDEVSVVAQKVESLLIVENEDKTDPPRVEAEVAMKLELHISESDLVDKPDDTETLTIETAEGKEGKEVYSCQSSPGYIKPPSKSTIVKQRSLDAQGPSDDEAEVNRSKRGSLHSPSSKILTKMTPITWDQWMKRPAGYVPPQKSPEKEAKAAPATEVDGNKPEDKKEGGEETKKGESPKVKKTRFQIIPQSADVLDMNRDEPKVLETFDETEEDKFLMENPNVLVESHLNQLTMVESQLKKLGAAAKVGVCTKRLGQPEPDQKNMGRASSGDQKSKGWLGWLSVFTKRPPPPSPPVKKQPARKPCPQHSRPQARQHARPAGPILANYDPKMVTVLEVQYTLL